MPEIKQLPLNEQVLHVTARIQCRTSNGSTCVGTGHFFDFAIGDKSYQFLITNKHVLKEAESCLVRFTAKGDNGLPQFGNYFDVGYENGDDRTPISEYIVEHPDQDVDLAVISITPMIAQFKKVMDCAPYIISLNASHVARDSDLEELSAIEDITMIGYPNGLWDEQNNLPIVRRGGTATPVWADYNGKKEFVIDIPVFGGSSGSPVFLLNVGSWTDRRGAAHIGGSRVKLLGVLWGGPIYHAEGNIEARPITTSMKPVAVTETLLNLGYCIKAERILEIEKLLAEKYLR